MSETFQNPFDVDPAKSTWQDRLYALYAVLRAQETASGKHCALPLAKGVARTFNMDYWDCGTAACAAGSAGLVPWFQDVVKSMRIFLKEDLARDPAYDAEGKLSRSEYLATIMATDVWGPAATDVRGLFWGRPAIYQGLIEERQMPEPDDRLATDHVYMNSLTAAQVKNALRRIIVNHLGPEANARCDELDQHCNLISVTD